MPLQVFNLACALNAHHRISPLHYACLSACTCCLFLLLGRQSNSRTYKSQTDAVNYAEPYSDTPVWVPSLRRRQLGRIEPHQRGEGLRHPVGDHRHGAEHDADLQQRHRHLCALLGTLSQAFFILQTPRRNKGDGSCCPKRLGVSPGTPARMRVFWTFSTEALAANESNALEVDMTGGTGRRKN